MTSKRAVFFLLVVLAAAACNRDPEAAKRQYMADGDRFMAERKYPEAIVQYRNAVRQDPRFGEGRLKMAEAFIAVGDARNALREAVRAADLMPDNVDAQLKAGSLLLVRGQFPEARQRAMAALAKEPKNARALLLMGNALARMKEIDAAVEQLEQAIDQDPRLTLGYANLGAALQAKGDQEAAEAAFRQAIVAAPDSVEAHLSLANFYWSAGRVQDAERELKATFEKAPKDAGVNRALAAFYINQNQPNAAEPFLKAYAELSGDVTSSLLLADFYVSRGNRTQATEILTALAARPESLSAATIRLAALDYASGRQKEAHARVDGLLADRPKDNLALETKVQFLLHERKGKEALAITTTLMDGARQTLRSRYLHGAALETTGAIDAAVKAFEELLNDVPSSLPVQIRLANMYLGQGRASNALALSQQIVKARPDLGDAHLLYAKALLKSGDLAGAERELRGLAIANPASADIAVWTGLLHEAKGEPAAARRAFTRALELQPSEPVALAGLVAADLAEKKPDAALARIQQRLAAQPNDPTLLRMSAMAYFDVRDLPKAEAAYRRLLEVDPNNIEAYARLGTIYVAQNRLEEARKSFEGIAANPSQAVVGTTMVGMILLRQNKLEEARAQFERALQLDPRAAVAANNLAWDYANNGGNIETALQLAQRAKAELPQVAAVSDTLGFVYYKKGLNGLAVSAFEEATKQDPANATYKYHLGLAYLQSGKKLEARNTFEQILKATPNFSRSAEVRQALAQAQG